LSVFGFLAWVAVEQMSRGIMQRASLFADQVEEYAKDLPLEQLGLASGRPLALPENLGRDLFATLLGAVRDLVSPVGLVLVVLLFMLLGRQGPLPDPTSLLGEIQSRVKNYLLKLVGLSALTGMLVWVVLAILGVQFAFVFGFLTFLLNFIPNIGSIIATLLPLPVIMLSPDLTATERVLALVLPAALQFGIGSVIQPRVMGEALDLHPVAVLLALIFFGMIWGVIGAFLALPITAIIKIVLERIPETRPAAAVLAGDLSVLTRPRPASAVDGEPGASAPGGNRPPGADAPG